MCENCEKLLQQKANSMYNQLRNTYEAMNDFSELVSSHKDEDGRIEFPPHLIMDSILDRATFMALVLDGYIDLKVVTTKVDDEYETTHFYKPVERDDIRTAH